MGVSMKKYFLILCLSAFGLSGAIAVPALAGQQLAQKAEDPEIKKIWAMIKDKRDQVEKKTAGSREEMR